MSTYHVKIKLEGNWADDHKASNTSLCMAKATRDASGHEIFNVIAISRPVETPNLDIVWTDEYQIVATTELFNNGAIIIGSADAKDIKFRETYAMAKWSDVSVVQDHQNVDQGSIGFRNGVKCSAVLSLKTNNAFVPVYISPATQPPGFLVLTPLPKVVFWWQGGAKTSTMISVFKGETITVSPEAGKVVNILYNTYGWKLGTEIAPR